MAVTNIDYFTKKYPNLNYEIMDVDNRISDVGDLVEITGAEAIIKNVLRELLIVNGTYLFDPERGIGIQKRVFEPGDNITMKEVAGDLDRCLYQYNGKANIQYDMALTRNGKGFIINFRIYYRGSFKTFTANITESLLDDSEDQINSYLTQTETIANTGTK